MSDAELAPCTRSALDMIRDAIARQTPVGRSTAGLMAPVLPDAAPT
jgi:hypothetical protein